MQFLKVEIAKIRKSFTLLAKMTKIESQTSSRALVSCTEIRQTIRNRFLRSRSSRMDENKPKQNPEISKIRSKNPGSQLY